MKIAFLCKGSRGDVVPLISIALTLHKRHPAVRVVLVCTQGAIEGLEAVLNREDRWLCMHHLPDPIKHTVGIEMDENKSYTNEDTRPLSIVKVQAMLNSEVKCCLDACTSEPVDGIVFNLFTLEGYLIANHLGVPSLAASPFILSRTPPKSFEKRFAQEHPFLYECLKKNNGNSCNIESVSYSDVDHWMWRMFLDDLSTACDEGGVVPSFPIPYPAHCPSPQWTLPPPTHLIYGLSPSLVPREQYWPETVHMCGFWQSHDLSCDQLEERILHYIEHHKGKLVYTGFGSMEDYMHHTTPPSDYWKEFLHTLNQVLSSLNLYSIVQCQNDGTLIKALSTRPLYSSLLIVGGYIPHDQLLPHCTVAAIHHGGNGTVSSAILAGVPQIIIPSVFFDQAHWGHIIEWKGLGRLITPGPHSSGGVTHDALREALLAVMKDEVMVNVKEMKERVSKENGTNVAVDILEREILFKKK